MTVFFTESEVKDYSSAKTCDTEKYAVFYRHLLESGIYAAPSQFEAMFISDAHTDEDLAATCKAIKAFKKSGK